MSIQFLSNKVYLAMNAALFIAFNGDETNPIPGSAIVEYSGLNKRALEPILQKLSQAGLIISVKGAKGGYYMPDKAGTNLCDIAQTFIWYTVPEKQEFTGYDRALIPFLKDSHDRWLDELRKVSFTVLCESACEEGGLSPISTPILNYAI